ncbi:hypothetical protein LPW11_15870 [Geomonas sp. RF6]|uniref:hypothetical protein n=1 Tax=Geomonas sp. RF6 TaxID=2897342 RepID=UPI001E455A00|nr:hypothetical protein [Geomonas sp. RF6]UFS69366.1 hypothetical protein LPW11_15870 [Geomonas sp. RF6]
MSKIVQQIGQSALGPLTVEEETVSRSYLFSDDFAGFAGHFPQFPILPAVVEILTVVSLMGEHLGAKQRLVAVEDAKFMNPVRPNQEVAVSCRPRTVRGKALYDAQLSVEGKTAAAFLLELHPVESVA